MFFLPKNPILVLHVWVTSALSEQHGGTFLQALCFLSASPEALAIQQALFLPSDMFQLLSLHHRSLTGWSIKEFSLQ